ncbi:hypothetical protein RM533_06370 [Croceicoccus sp. F390]|uniref:Uncharacterized protein n=1 Tax=Croceicoccus esteveae TaxID=3075597 RepID=A0ABU2ZK80_9SPHN|nr:hypothetical protein [Croceicoccus sp. F390]MDT0575807.1 hypothetical protein [Croceicoccus sp. F390]
MIRVLLVMVLSLAAFTPAAALERTLAPSTTWVASYEDDSCVLARQFGTGKDQVVVRLERFGPADSFWMQLIGKPFRLSESQGSRDRKVSVSFGDIGRYERISFYNGTGGNKAPAAIFRRSFSVTGDVEEESEEELAL